MALFQVLSVTMSSILANTLDAFMNAGIFLPKPVEAPEAMVSSTASITPLQTKPLIRFASIDMSSQIQTVTTAIHFHTSRPYRLCSTARYLVDG